MAEQIRIKNQLKISLMVITSPLSKFAKQNNVFIHGGSIYERSDDKVSNTSVIIDNNGSFITKYRKIHLFDVTIPNGTSYRESDSIKPGKTSLHTMHSILRLDVRFCYDLRFAELFLTLAKKLVDIIVRYPRHLLIRQERINGRLY